MVYLGIDLFAGAGCFAYIGRPYQNLSESDRLGYSDVDFAAIVADYPFYPLGGKLTEKVDFVRILKIGLWLFAASGILYLISNKMWQLIVVSALLGIGSGLIIPLSTGLISKYFVGTYRVKQFGLSSAITNFTLVIATAVTGYLAEVSWHLPFLVYLLPLISILLVGHLKESRSDTAVEPSSQSTTPSEQTAAADTGGSKYGIHIRHLLQIMLFTE